MVSRPVSARPISQCKLQRPKMTKYSSAAALNRKKGVMSPPSFNYPCYNLKAEYNDNSYQDVLWNELNQLVC